MKVELTANQIFDICAALRIVESDYEEKNFTREAKETKELHDYLVGIRQENRSRREILDEITRTSEDLGEY